MQQHEAREGWSLSKGHRKASFLRCHALFQFLVASYLHKKLDDLSMALWDLEVSRREEEESTGRTNFNAFPLFSLLTQWHQTRCGPSRPSPSQESDVVGLYHGYWHTGFSQLLGFRPLPKILSQVLPSVRLSFSSIPSWIGKKCNLCICKM